MAVRIQFRRGTKVQWETANPVLAAGELGYQSTEKVIKFGDGTTAWNSLEVAAAGDIYAVIAGNGLKYGTQTEPAGPGGSSGLSGVVELEIDDSKVITTNAMNAKGDLLVGTSDNQYAVLSSGTDGQALVVNTGAPTGLTWGTVTDPVITAGYINSTMLGAASVTEEKIRGSATVDADRSITTAKIRDGAITSTKLGTNAVLTAAIADGQVTETKLSGDGSTDGTRAVTTNKIRNLAVTRDKIANNAVDSTKVGTDVYQRGGTGFTATSARVFIQSVTPTGAAGDIWFRYA